MRCVIIPNASVSFTTDTAAKEVAKRSASLQRLCLAIRAGTVVAGKLVNIYLLVEFAENPRKNASQRRAKGEDR